MARKTALAFGIGASLILAAGTASADGTASANCAAEVSALQQQLGMMPGATISDMSASGGTITGSRAPTESDQISETGTAVNPTWSSNDPGEPAAHDQRILPDSAMSESTATGVGEADAPTRQTGVSVNPTWSSNDPGEPPQHDERLYPESTTADTGTGMNEPAAPTRQTGLSVNPTWSSNDPGEPPRHDQQAVPGTTSSDIVEPSARVGTGTITETTRSGTLDVPADSRSAAFSSLRKAELYANAGQEDACLVELRAAKQHINIE